MELNAAVHIVTFTDALKADLTSHFGDLQDADPHLLLLSVDSFIRRRLLSREKLNSMRNISFGKGAETVTQAQGVFTIDSCSLFIYLFIVFPPKISERTQHSLFDGSDC